MKKNAKPKRKSTRNYSENITIERNCFSGRSLQRVPSLFGEEPGEVKDMYMSLSSDAVEVYAFKMIDANADKGGHLKLEIHEILF